MTSWELPGGFPEGVLHGRPLGQSVNSKTTPFSEVIAQTTCPKVRYFFHLNRQILNILGFLGHMVSVASIQCNLKIVTDSR